MRKKIEIVKNQLGAMKVEQKSEDDFYVRFRKSESNKAMLDDIFQYEDIMKGDGWKRIGDYELTLNHEAFEEIYQRYMDKIYSRSF